MKSTVKDLRELPAILDVDPDLMNVLGIGRVKAYQIVNMEGFPSIRLGKSIKIPRDAFINWLNNSASQTVSA